MGKSLKLYVAPSKNEARDDIPFSDYLLKERASLLKNISNDKRAGQLYFLYVKKIISRVLITKTSNFPVRRDPR